MRHLCVVVYYERILYTYYKLGNNIANFREKFDEWDKEIRYKIWYTVL